MSCVFCAARSNSFFGKEKRTFPPMWGGSVSDLVIIFQKKTLPSRAPVFLNYEKPFAPTAGPSTHSRMRVPDACYPHTTCHMELKQVFPSFSLSRSRRCNRNMSQSRVNTPQRQGRICETPRQEWPLVVIVPIGRRCSCWWCVRARP